MTILIDYLATYAPWIYFVCGVVALYQMYRTWLVRAERRQAVFSLEREKAVRDLGNIFSIAMSLLFVMGITYFMSTTLVQALEPLVNEARSPSPDLDFVPTPTNTPLPAAEAGAIDPVPQLRATLATTLTPGETQPVDTSAPTIPAIAATNTPAPIVQAPSCSNGSSIILRPGANEQVSGVITIVGTADHPSFQYYKIEYAPAGTNNWGYLSGDQNAVVSGVLANINTAELGNGAWTIRLVVVDQTGNYPEPCQVTLFVEN